MKYDEQRFSSMCKKITKLMKQDQSDASVLSNVEKICIQVWHAHGVIGNGGFPFFFECDVSFEDTEIAFEEIGYEKGVQVFKHVQSQFPRGRLPGKLQELKDFVDDNYEKFMDMSVEIFNTENELFDKLYQYMVRHGLLEV